MKRDYLIAILAVFVGGGISLGTLAAPQLFPNLPRRVHLATFWVGVTMAVGGLIAILVLALAPEASNPAAVPVSPVAASAPAPKPRRHRVTKPRNPVAAVTPTQPQSTAIGPCELAALIGQDVENQRCAGELSQAHAREGVSDTHCQLAAAVMQYDKRCPETSKFQKPVGK